MTLTSLRPLVLIGPSGAGKSTVAERLAALPSVEVIPTVTTRPVRPQEDPHTHTFVDQPTFDAMQARGDFIGTTHSFGHDYGLPKLPATQKQLVLLLRAPFVEPFRTSYPDALVVQLEAPLPVLLERLAQRGDRARADADLLEKEIAFGRTLADLVVSTDQPIEDYIGVITAELTGRQTHPS